MQKHAISTCPVGFWGILRATVLTVALIAAHPEAKCPRLQFEFHGTVVSGKTNQPLQGAKIYVFFDRDDYCMTTSKEVADERCMLSNEDGLFSGKGDFYTYAGSSRFFTDKCKEAPSEIEVFVLRTGFFPLRKHLVVGKDVAIKETSTGKTIELPMITMEPQT